MNSGLGLYRDNGECWTDTGSDKFAKCPCSYTDLRDQPISEDFSQKTMQFNVHACNIPASARYWVRPCHVSQIRYPDVEATVDDRVEQLCQPEILISRVQ